MKMAGLTDAQQAIIVFFTALLAALGGWAGLGFPTSHVALGVLVAAIIAGAGLALKELGGTVPTATPTAST